MRLINGTGMAKIFLSLRDFLYYNFMGKITRQSRGLSLNSGYIYY